MDEKEIIIEAQKKEISKLLKEIEFLTNKIERLEAAANAPKRGMPWSNW